MIKLGKELNLDLPKLIDTRLLIQANSGGGKSYLIRKLLEETHGKVQQIVLDLEGEFSTLSEKFDYVLIGKDGHFQPKVSAADLLARKLLEENVSAIIDLYELKQHERIRFVKLFLDSMVNAPKKLWHPCLVIIDEAHIFCPEKSKSESMASVIDIATRGRKRGYCAVLATQRLSKLHKDAAAECNNKLIGRTGLDVDMKRASEELGFTTKQQMLSLRDLDAGEFFAFGSAISRQVIKVKIGKVKTQHPQTGGKAIITPKAITAKLKAVLSKLSDLPQEAEKELRVKQDYIIKINELKREIRNMKFNAPKEIDEKQMERIKQIGFQQGFKKGDIEFRQMHSGMKKLVKSLELRIINAQTILGKEFKTTPGFKSYELPKIPTLTSRPIFQPKKIENPSEDYFTKTLEEVKLKTGAIRMLNAIAMFKTVSRNRVKTISGISSQGTFSTYVQDLKRANYIEINGTMLTITLDGETFIGEPQPLPSDTESLINLWSKHLKTGTIRMLRICVNVYPNSISRAELKEESGISSQGTFSTYTQDLKRNQLIEINGSEITAAKELFE